MDIFKMWDNNGWWVKLLVNGDAHYASVMGGYDRKAVEVFCDLNDIAVGFSLMLNCVSIRLGVIHIALHW